MARTVVLAAVGLVVVAYVGIVGVLYFGQRSLLYHNWHAVAETPHISGLPITDLRLPTSDGESLEAWYEAPAPGKPVFLFFHGQGGTLADGKWRYIRLHDKGVGFLALAYRGYSGSTGHPSEKGLLIDGLTAYDWLAAQGFKPSDIVITGHSLGTGVGVYVATQRPARALILEAPFTAASDVAQGRYPFAPAQWLMQDKFLSRERIKAVHMPVLIIHGDKDKTIPFIEGQQLFALANQPKTFVRMHGSNHSTLTRDGAYGYYWRFLGMDK